MRRIVCAKASALETKIAIWRVGGRDRPRELRHWDRMLFIADIDDPVGKKNLVAIGVGGFSVGEHKSPVENSAINGVERNAHPGVLRGRFESAYFALFFRIAQIQNDETVAAESAVSAVTAVLQFFWHVDRTVQARERGLVFGDPWRYEL